MKQLFLYGSYETRNAMFFWYHQKTFPKETAKSILLDTFLPRLLVAWKRHRDNTIAEDAKLTFADMTATFSLSPPLTPTTAI